MMRSATFLPLLAVVALLPHDTSPPGPHRTDTNHSTLGFSVPILGGLSQVTGKFSRFKVDLDYDAEKPENSRVVAVIEAASIDTGIDARDAHLRADDFLNVAEFPEIIFESFEVVPEDDRLRVIGVLTMRDVSRDVELDVRILKHEDKPGNVGFFATTTFNRQDFGVRYKHRDIPDFIGDDVTLQLHMLSRPVASSK